MQISAIFENTDQAEMAARGIHEQGIRLRQRRVVSTGVPEEVGSHLPTEHFYFPAAAEFYSGMVSRVDVITPGASFYPMSGHVRLEAPGSAAARLVLDVDDRDAEAVRDLLISQHGSGIRMRRS
ncbi:MAG: hypothetical protein E7458_07650 [Ruminococcaceae bacterium]|nr:hypothetical protein [Oscillospiraceae bacterium]